MTSQKKKFPLVRFLISICILLCAGFMWVLYHTTLFVGNRTAPEGYLDISSYKLYDENGEADNDPLRSIDGSSYTWYTDMNTLKTAEGIGPGCTWEEFLQAYGSYKVKYIDIYNENADYENDEYYATHHLNDITPEEFDRRFLQTGIIDPENEDIDITFGVYARGTELLYTQPEIDTALDKYYDTFFMIGPWSFSLSPQYHTVTMDFEFRPMKELYGHEDEAGFVLYSVSIYKY